MAWTIPDDIVTLIAARTQALAVEEERRAALQAEREHRRAREEQECRALAEPVCAFARALAAAVALPPEGIEVWSCHRSRGGDELRVRAGQRGGDPRRR